MLGKRSGSERPPLTQGRKNASPSQDPGRRPEPACRRVPGTEKGRAVMRVVVNQLAALRQKTGIGHYTNQLLRCLHAQAG